MILLQALGFGLAIAFMLIGVIGVIVPVIPGTLLIWLTTVIYAWATDYEIITIPLLVVFTIVSLITGLADFWLPLLGAKQRGASKRGMFLGFVGGIIGTIIFPLVGTIIGYGLGILLGEYHKRRDWQTSWRASLGGMAGWGLATAVQLGGAIFLLVVFAARVLTA